MRLPLTAFAAYFLVREWQGLDSSQGNAVHRSARGDHVVSRPDRGDDDRAAQAGAQGRRLGAALAALAGFPPALRATAPAAAPSRIRHGTARRLGSLLAGHLLCAVALMQLGRSLSILPEARRLVTEGLYARVRHPLYLGEAMPPSGYSCYIGYVGVCAGAIQFCPASSGACREEYPDGGNRLA